MKKGNGFTLIELMVSISIIAILTALAAISFTTAQKKARDARRTQDMKLLQLAAEQYASQNAGAYMTSTATPWNVAGNTVLESLPIDPKNGSSYILSTSANSYCFCAGMENPATGNATATGIGCSFSGSSTGNTGPYFCAKNQQ